MNIVIVEDDINMRKSLEIALGEYDDLKIKSYKSAVEALKWTGWSSSSDWRANLTSSS